MLALPYLSCCCLNLQIVTFEMVLDIYSLSTGSSYVYTVTFFLPPKGSDDLQRLTASWRYWFLVNGSCYLPFHWGRGSLTGAMHLTSQCNEAFLVKQILDLLQEKCALKKDERTTYNRGTFSEVPRKHCSRRTVWCLFVHTQSYLSLWNWLLWFPQVLSEDLVILYIPSSFLCI